VSALDWHDQAACAEFGVGVFVADNDGKGSGSAASAVYRQARAICERCPVQETCLEYAMENEGTAPTGGRAGVYGGLSPKQRYHLHLKRLTAEMGTAA
jgi:WhiB family redox-sensing transcriptional regulator